jgi:hypothetical protein
MAPQQEEAEAQSAPALSDEETVQGSSGEHVVESTWCQPGERFAVTRKQVLGIPGIKGSQLQQALGRDDLKVVLRIAMEESADITASHDPIATDEIEIVDRL